MNIREQQFLTWGVLSDYVTFVGIVFSIVAVTKNAPVIKLVPTRGYSILVAFLLLLLVNLQAGTFNQWDIVMYFINAVIISSSASGLADINKGEKK